MTKLNTCISKTKLIKIKERSYELLLLSSAHGLPRLLKAKKLFFTLMWLLFLLSSIFLGSYFVINTVLDYLKFYTNSNIKIINEQRAQFPTIAFCSYPKTNATLNETILRLRFDAVDEYDAGSLMEEFNDDYYGKCFRFNSGKNAYDQKIEILSSDVPGFDNGFNLNVYLRVPRMYDFTEMIFFIYNHSLPPLNLYNSGYWLKTGSWNYFEIERVFIENLDRPFSVCLMDISLFSSNKTLIDYILRHNDRIYTQKDCLDLCGYMFTMSESDCKCGSSLGTFFTQCYVNSLNRNCTREYLKYFRKNLQLKKCLDYCPLECNSMNYVINTYNEHVPTSGYITQKENVSIDTNGQFRKFKTYEEVNRNFIGLRVYYKNLMYSIITQSPRIEAYNLIASIGGIWSLCLGISFISIIEMIEIFLEIILILIWN
jgi:hypothetical protein